MIKDFCAFSDELEVILNDAKMQSYKDRLLGMCHFFLRFSREDFAKFKVMLLTEPPESINDPGPYEKSHEPRAFELIRKTIDLAQKAGETTTKDSPFIIAGIVWSFLLGAATSVLPLYAYLGEDFLSSNISPDNQDPKVLLHALAVSISEKLIFS